MSSKGIEQHFENYRQWRTGLFDGIGDLRDWLKNENLSDVQLEQRLDAVQTTLRDDKLYIAFVAEFSRGKSELINALFFGGMGQRILPSSAGRTTMCPTELMYDNGAKPYLKLLPIETRNSGTSISEYKGFDEEWTSVKLPVDSPDKMVAVLKHLAEVKTVTVKQAASLGFKIAEDGSTDGIEVSEDGTVEIPKWRHALINFPHPLLEQGLVILDTPGLNALGAEPELTISMLPGAHGILFILAADAGVTKSDIEVWHDHIGSKKGGSSRGRLVVLNKIDGLWDELRDSKEVEKEIARQVRDTAKHLNIPEDNIFPVSAQKGLAAKIKKDKELLARSRITELEDALGQQIVPAKREIVRDNINDDMSEFISSIRAVMAQRTRGVQEHMDELSGLSGKNRDVVEHMMKKVREDKDVFEKSLQRFQATRSIFSQQTNVLYSHLNLKKLDQLIAETKRNMEISMTTSGLKGHMHDFFKTAITTMEEVAKQAQEIKSLMEGVYQKFQEEHGLSNIKPSGFSVMRYMRELKRLETKHEQFVNSLSLMMMEQKVVSKNFYETVVSKIRAIFKMANRDADNWLKNIMSPMEAQVREHQVQLRRRLESIKRIHQATDTLEDRMQELEANRAAVRKQEQALEARLGKILDLLYYETAETRKSRKQ